MSCSTCTDGLYLSKDWDNICLSHFPRCMTYYVFSLIPQRSPVMSQKPHWLSPFNILGNRVPRDMKALKEQRCSSNTSVLYLASLAEEHGEEGQEGLYARRKEEHRKRVGIWKDIIEAHPYTHSSHKNLLCAYCWARSYTRHWRYRDI